MEVSFGLPQVGIARRSSNLFIELGDPRSDFISLSLVEGPFANDLLNPIARRRLADAATDLCTLRHPAVRKIPYARPCPHSRKGNPQRWRKIDGSHAAAGPAI
jgi:hypothetical protein